MSQGYPTNLLGPTVERGLFRPCADVRSRQTASVLPNYLRNPIRLAGCWVAKGLQFGTDLVTINYLKYTPLKIKMKPRNHPIEKKSSFKPSILGSMSILEWVLIDLLVVRGKGHLSQHSWTQASEKNVTSVSFGVLLDGTRTQGEHGCSCSNVDRCLFEFK